MISFDLGKSLWPALYPLIPTFLKMVGLIVGIKLLFWFIGAVRRLRGHGRKGRQV